jgi:hypothetical protein
MQYISHYLQSNTADIFSNNEFENLKTGEMILYPIKDYGTKYLSFKLGVVPHIYTSNIPESLLHEPAIKDTLEFFKHSVFEVFQAVMHHNLTDDVLTKVLEASFHLEFDDKNMVFYPVYVHPLRRQKGICDTVKHDLEKFYTERQSIWESIEQEIKDNWNNQYSQVVAFAETLPYSSTSAKLKEDEMNEFLLNSDRIGIIFSEYSEDEISNNEN